MLQTKPKLVEIQRSNTALTVPKTPQFAKSKSRAMNCGEAVAE